MHVYQEKNDIIVTQMADFSLNQTIECGQCFHYFKYGENDYGIVAFKDYTRVVQNKNELKFYNTNIQDYYNIWEHYFDLKRDYKEIKQRLLEKDPSLNQPIQELWGMRILNQNFFETLISFIISQNQQIPRIKQIIVNLSQAMGEQAGENMNTFPCAEKILQEGLETVKSCKAGFRSSYIIDACENYVQGNLLVDELNNMSYLDCMDRLKTIKGVGDKVANCVSLFSLNKRNAFPIDVWIKRIMEELYFHRIAKNEEISELAIELFGEYGGYAQQYLFYFGMQQGIGKKK